MENLFSHTAPSKRILPGLVVYDKILNSLLLSTYKAYVLNLTRTECGPSRAQQKINVGTKIKTKNKKPTTLINLTKYHF